MHRYWASFVVLFLCFPTTKATAAIDSRQLVGTWVRTTLADIQAMELGKGWKGPAFTSGAAMTRHEERPTIRSRPMAELSRSTWAD